MSDLSRRHVMLGLGAAAASPVGLGAGLGSGLGFGLAAGLATSATAATATAAGVQDASEAAPQQGAGFYRFTVGDIECFSLGDGASQLPARPFWGENATEEAMDALLGSAAVDPAAMWMHFNVMLIRSGGETWLVDGGNGGARGATRQRLATLGVDPADVDGIVISHMHGDHFAGLIGEDGSLVYPNATYHINRAEADFWGNSPNLDGTSLPAASKQRMASGAAAALTAIEGSGRVERVDDLTDVGRGLTLRKTGGHTPGHQTVVIESGGSRFEMIVDAVHHHVMSFRRPEWHIQFDYDAKEGARVRSRELDRLAGDQIPVMCYHTPFPGVGHVGRRGAAYEWMAAPWQW
ncbi:MAG: MBL fold metallo-hydrolase [Phycisphaerales bacterium]